MVNKVCIIDLSKDRTINHESIIFDMLSKTGVYEVEIKHRFSIADANDFDFIVFLNPRIDIKSISLIEKISYNMMTLNPRLSVFQFVPFVIKDSNMFKYSPSELSLIALSGALSFTGRTPTTSSDALYPHPPTNLLNSPMTAMAVSSTLSMHILSGSHCGQYNIHPVINDWIYMTYFIMNYKNMHLVFPLYFKFKITLYHLVFKLPFMLDGTAPYYSIYRARDWRYLIVGWIESKFFNIFVDKLPITEDDKNFLIANQFALEEWPKLKEIIQKVIMTETAQYWHDLYKNTDAWVCKVFTVQEAAKL